MNEANDSTKYEEMQTREVTLCGSKIYPRGERIESPGERIA